MAASKKVKALSFSDLCGNTPPTVTSGTQEVKIKELADYSEVPSENNFDHVRGGTIKFRDPNAGDHHTAKVAALGNGYLGDFNLSSVNQSANKLSWSFSVADSVLDHLQEGETLTQRYKVTINDGHGGKTTDIITVKICGTEDKPQITYCDGEDEDDGEDSEHDISSIGRSSQDESHCEHGTTGYVSEDSCEKPTGDLTDDGSFQFTDVDLKDQHILTVTSDSQNAVGGVLTAVITDPSTGDGQGEVHWTYTLNNSLAQSLCYEDEETERFYITIDDQHGGTVVQQITVYIQGADDSPIPS